MMEFQVAAKTDQGRVRQQNQDAFLNDLPLIAVADGMGGHKGGEVASQTALDVLRDWKDRIAKQGPDVLKDALLEANKKVWAKGREDENLQGMGTTLTAAWLHENTATLAHVGDSRAYLLRGGRLSQLTEDQTIVKQWEKEGTIAPGEAARHPRRHILLQAIGSENEVEVDMTSVELAPGDRLLLATDGLHGMVVDDDRLRDILLAYPNAEDACRVLVDAANEAGGDDNITVLLLDVVVKGAEVVDSNAPVIVSKPSSKPAGDRARRNSRTLIQGVIALLATGAIVGAMVVFVLNRGPSYVVATHEGYVAILEGSPGRAGNPATGQAIRVFRDAPLERFPRHTQRDLRAGIPVGSIEEGERVAATLPKVLAPDETAAPTPTPSPEPEPQPSPGP